MQFNTQNTNDGHGHGHVKSYSCSFCKRGFTNAQALGGHMNTHRRDRARLKQSYEENMLSLDISIKNTNNNDHEHVLDKDNDHAPQKGKVIGTENLPQYIPSFVGMITAINEIKGGDSVLMQMIEDKKGYLDLELKLGSDMEEESNLSTRKNCKKPFTFCDKDNDHGPLRGKRIEGKKVELDLELRLGIEPHETPTLSTIEFF
ncbi:hypothetical protein TanjilG_14438 [Lupinus angustifolius]|uniref:C2H2-type domain-containing protein n=1 Tax=Lupinus angustifolius TaxID=3871 RepID=A0A1J7H4F2_LUPAN|nr:hypothetical protein TanjilG_14438 [Lupinus angustifolius]